MRSQPDPPRSRPHRPKPARSRRTGAVLTAELIILMPLVVGVSMVIIQFILLASARARVDAAALEGARLAALGETHAEVHEGVGMVLSPHLSGAYETVLQYRNKKDSEAKIDDEDSVIVQVRIPQSIVGHNWLGFFGGEVTDLHLRSVVERRIEQDVEIQPPTTSP